MRAPQRWAALLVGLAVLVALPVLVSLRPLHAEPATAAQLLAHVRQSDSTAYSGLVEVHGDLSLPDLPGAAGLAGLVSGTTRLRVWRSSASKERVDQLSSDGETDTITNGDEVTAWDSTRDEVTESTGLQPLRVPQSGDLLPPALAERLTPDGLAAQARRLPATRIAGRTALGLRLTPTASTTTVAYVDIDVDQQSGLPLRVAVTARGRSSPSFSADFLAVKLGPPSSAALSFVAPEDAVIRHARAPDFVADANRYAPFQLPSTLAGLPRTQRVSEVSGNGGAATYGRGYTLLALLPMQQRTAVQVIKALQPPTGIAIETSDRSVQAAEERLPLVNVFAMDGEGRAYLLTGTVTPPLLLKAADQLLEHPPPFRPRLRFDRQDSR